MERKAELEARPKALREAKDQVLSIRAFLANETAMAGVHVNDTKVIVKATETLEKWLEETEAKEVVLTEKPPYKAADIYAEMRIHHTTVTEALRPKPKAKEKKPKKDKKPKETKKEKKARLKKEK